MTKLVPHTKVAKKMHCDSIKELNTFETKDLPHGAFQEEKLVARLRLLTSEQHTKFTVLTLYTYFNFKQK